MSQEADELKPCPFCGSTYIRIESLPKIYDAYTFKILEACVECLTCGAEGPKIAFVSDIRKAWNDCQRK